ncbi:exonuclease domain-containing protein [Embleya sp. NPDC059267]|uniref:exonuclease domain-containing protein n=1 Tax=unclassified Embleya TaxID=2699296 RepID=UPI0034050ED5
MHGSRAIRDEVERQVFTVVDLETTGLDPQEARITEIAAVRVRGTDRLGEFATLVAPGVPIPEFITDLTGISDDLVADAPPLHLVLPAFTHFAEDAVLVAHNAPFDVGFLRAASLACGRPWPDLRVVDTLALARALLPPGTVPNMRLGTLARYFEAPTDPTHRALADARATAHVLRAFIGRMHESGRHELADLLDLGRPPAPRAWPGQTTPIG